MKYLLLALMFMGMNLSAAELARVIYVQKNVYLLRGEAKPVRIKPNDPIQEGDKLMAEDDARAKIALIDSRNVMNILPGTTVVINKLNIKDLEAVDIEMNLIKGKIRNDLKHKFNSNSKFEIRTPNSVIGVRGTNFLTGYDPDNFTTEIITFEGTVWFRKLSTLQQGFKNNEEVLVGPSEKSDNVKDGAPGAAAKVPDDQIKKLLDETEVLNPKDKKANKNKKDADASSSSK